MTLEAILPLHKVVPSWTLADAAGRPFSLFKPRGRAHTLLLVATAGFDIGGYLAEVAPHLAELQGLPARGIAVLGTAKPPTVPSWTTLADSEGRVIHKYLPTGAQVGLFILDRYSELYHQWVGAGGQALPPVVDAVEWIEAIGRQCAI
ncbi:MAG: hypothetical protein H0X37_07365 [Herpetosiphonaceae bacterium]|nr:hypothetical protein [Herpetosiphonaceae bacterium]